MKTDHEPTVADDLPPPQESLRKAALQVLVGGVLFAALTVIYLHGAHENHQVELRLADALPLVDRGDVASLKRARELYLEAAEIRRDPRAVVGLAQATATLWVLHGMSEFEADALEAVQTAQEVDRESGEVSVAAALVAIAQKRYGEAVSLGEEALQARGGQAAIHWILGLSHRAQGNLRKGREQLQKAHDMKGVAPHFALSLGDAYEADFEPRNAHAFWLQAANQNPEFVPAQGRSVMAKARSQQTRSVLDAELDRLTKLSPQQIGKQGQAAVALARAEVQYYRGQWAASLKAANDALELGGETPMAWHAVGRAQIALGNIDEGLAAYDKALVSSGGADKYVLTHVEALAAAGRYEVALGVLEGSPSRAVLMETPRYHVAVGDVHLGRGDLAAAKVAYDRALQIQARSPEACLGRARIAWKQNAFDEATQWLEKAVEARSDFPDAYETVGHLWIERGAASEGNSQLLLAEKLMRAQGADPMRMRRFYERAAQSLTRHRESKLAAPWSARAKTVGGG